MKEIPVSLGFFGGWGDRDSILFNLCHDPLDNVLVLLHVQLMKFVLGFFNFYLM